VERREPGDEGCDKSDGGNGNGRIGGAEREGGRKRDDGTEDGCRRQGAHMATVVAMSWDELSTTLRRLAARTTSTCFTYRVTGLAAEAAFFAILSLPPLVFGLAGTIGYFAQSYDVAQIDLFKDRVLYMASQVITPTTVDELIAPTLDEVLSGGRFDVVSLGFVLALWSGSRALNVFIDTITIMYGLGGHRGIVKTRALSFALYVVALVIGIVVVPLVLAGPQVVVDVLPEEAMFLRRAYWPSVLVLSAGFMTTLYHLSVPVRKPWRMGVPGAVFTLVMWILGSYFVRWVLGVGAVGTSIYGPLAAPIAMLLLLYVLSISVLIGAALNAAIDVDRNPPADVAGDTSDDAADPVVGHTDEE
jgi:membrane protein